MDRRRFLRYAGATAAVVGASALGLDYLSQPSPLSESPTTLMPMRRESTTTKVSSASSTESAQLASLQGRVFFDYNGNGVQDGEEPAVSNAVVQLRRDPNSNATAETVTDSAGDYQLEDFPTGSYRLYVLPEEKKFRYMCRSAEEFRDLSNGYDLSLDESGKMDIGLMEGFLTSPFNRNKTYRFDFFDELDIPAFVDLDHRPKHIRDWRGGQQTYDGHRGTDFVAEERTEIFAAAPGRIFFAWNGWPNKPSWGDQNDTWKNGNSVIVYHENGFWSSYNHLNSVAVNEASWGSLKQSVKRGDLIGYMGYTGFRPDLVTPMTANQVHLHFQITATELTVGNDRDPFRDLYYGQHGDSPMSNSVSLWTVDNKLEYS
jgi:murein DD-endopeptidase MepM/ murein hydrolase activator NlpD